jgi:alkanesulfonate monooxygenase SsuD/methylene tetrahydromethanopterin reductase-like flavin-dependent oxidoreductase (luciferase family)
MGMIRGGLLPADAKLTLGPGPEANEIDPDDPLPVIRLLNRQMLGMELDPEEVFDILEPLDAVIVGDVDACTAKIKRFAEIGVDRLLCFQQFGGLANEDVLKSMRLVGKEILPEIGA